MGLVFRSEAEDWSKTKVLELVALACVVGAGGGGREQLKTAAMHPFV